MYQYTDATLVEFYNALEDTGFFESGILLIVGDHRKMTPLEAGEYEKFGLSAYGRVICTVIGKGIPENLVDNNIYQQTDIYHSIKRLIADNFIDAPPYNDILLSNVQRPYATHSLFSNRSNLVVVTEEDVCTVHLDGDDSTFDDCDDSTKLLDIILNDIKNERAYQFKLNAQR
jgi:hypothetical protein